MIGSIGDWGDEGRRKMGRREVGARLWAGSVDGYCHSLLLSSYHNQTTYETDISLRGPASYNSTSSAHPRISEMAEGKRWVASLLS